jgi:hypothetical protein
MNRRDLIKLTSAAGLIPVFQGIETFSVAGGVDQSDRKYWVDTLTKIADPVLVSLSAGELHKKMPVECKPGTEADRRKYSHLEAFGRLMTGMAPWLALAKDDTVEGKLREKYTKLARQSLKMAVDPGSPDFMNFSDGSQPLVDSAFLAHAILRAPGILWHQLDQQTQQHLVAAMKSSRVIVPGNNNWLLFAAMVEAFLFFAGEQPDMTRVEPAISRHLEWYKGDGWYGDGPEFHWDYYNSFVIHPMLLDVLDVFRKKESRYENIFETELKRAGRYAVIQERLVSPEGTFPVIGRSVAYRFGAFHLLGQLALQHRLPGELAPEQVRSALSAVIKRMIEAPGTFDENGWLKIGFCGHQPGAGESYISTGSLYLCTAGLLPLGLPPSDPFWTGQAADWTSRKIWKGKDFESDHALMSIVAG